MSQGMGTVQWPHHCTPLAQTDQLSSLDQISRFSPHLLHFICYSSAHLLCPLPPLSSSSPPCVLFPFHPWHHTMYICLLQRKGTKFINFTDAHGLMMQVACKRNWLYARWTELHTHPHTLWFGLVMQCAGQREIISMWLVNRVPHTVSTPPHPSDCGFI